MIYLITYVESNPNREQWLVNVHCRFIYKFHLLQVLRNGLENSNFQPTDKKHFFFCLKKKNT